MSPRHVTQILPGTALSGTQTSLLGSLAFPDAGGVQAVDLDGTVHDLVGSSGALTATIIDADVSGASVGLDVRHRLSSGTPVAGMGSAITLSAQTSAGGVGTPIGAEIAMVYSDVTAGAQFAGLSFSLRVNGTVTEALGLSATATTRTIATAGSGNIALRIVPLGTGGIDLRDAADAATVLGVQNVSSTFFGLAVENAVASTAGGAVTVNAVSGRIRILQGAIGPLVITNNRVKDANSIVIPIIRTLDATLTQVICIAAAGQFTITGNANSTGASVDVDFIVINRAT